MNWDIPAVPPTFILMSFDNDERKRFNFTPNIFDFNSPYFDSNGIILNYNFFNETFNFTDFDITTLPCSSNQNSISNVISMILYAIVCIVGLFGNTLVIYVVLRFSKMQTVTNMYILNLAIADECYLIGIPFLLITIYLGHWTFGESMCKAYMVSTSITQFTSSIFLLIMSADRYIAVCHPVSSQRIRTPLISKIVSFIAWLTSAIIMLPVILFSSTIEYEQKRYSCIIKWPEDHGTESGTTFTLYALILGFAIPLSFILLFYCLVLRKLHTAGPKNKSKCKKRSHRKVTKLVLTVITVYILCWLPHWISQVALIHSSPHNCRSKLEITIFLLVGCLGYSNSAMNPILYAFLSDNFKKSFMKAFTCTGRKEINAQLQMENSLFPKFGNKNRCNSINTGNCINGSGGSIVGGSKKLLSTTIITNDITTNDNRINLTTSSSPITTITTGTGNGIGTSTGISITLSSIEQKTLATNSISTATTTTTTTTTANEQNSFNNKSPIMNISSNNISSSKCLANENLDFGIKSEVLHTDL